MLEQMSQIETIVFAMKSQHQSVRSAQPLSVSTSVANIQIRLAEQVSQNQQKNV